ncbi:hypothetical protein BGU66_24025 [Clostridioides difficile]|nr:hypothetical protein BGU66_24025 [Clostridioides difficile]
MFFVNRDTLLNYVVLELGNCNINWGQWAFYMSVPTIITKNNATKVFSTESTAHIKIVKKDKHIENFMLKL